MPIKKILFPTKFRELAFNSLESILVLKKAGLREVILCRVISRDEVGFVPFGGYLKDEEEKIREETRIRFEDWQKSLSKKGINSKIVIVVGEPIPQILSVADEEKVDLIIVGRKKKIATEKSFIGSYTPKIISRSKIPILASKYMVQFELNDTTLTRTNDRIFEMPLLAVDWSEPSARALEFLISIKGVVKRVFVFHSIDVKESKGNDKSEMDRIERKCCKKVERCCEKLKLAGVKAEPHIGAGEIVQEILRVSRERNASMIITGTTGKARLHEIWSGSVSHEVAKLSELPTLLVP